MKNENTEKVPLRAADMDVVGAIFGIRFLMGDLFELYIEDDGLYHHKLTANNYWLLDLANVVAARNP